MTVAYVVLHPANSSTVDLLGSKQARMTGPQLALCVIEHATLCLHTPPGHETHYRDHPDAFGIQIK